MSTAQEFLQYDRDILLQVFCESAIADHVFVPQVERQILELSRFSLVRFADQNGRFSLAVRETQFVQNVGVVPGDHGNCTITRANCRTQDFHCVSYQIQMIRAHGLESLLHDSGLDRFLVKWEVIRRERHHNEALSVEPL